LFEPVDQLAVPDEDGCSLVDVGGMDLQEIMCTVRPASPCLLGKKSERCGLIQQAQLALGAIHLARIAKDAAV
jgi:hypothetical protein